MENILESKYIGLTRPNAIRDAFVNFAKYFGIEITQNKTVADFCAPFNVVAVGATTLEFVPSGFIYPDSEHFIIVGIRMYQGANATLLATAWTPGIAAGDAQNGSITINNNGTIEEKQMPLTVFSQGTNNADGGYLELSKPIIWKGQTEFKVTGNFPVALTTANLNLRIELVGLKLI